jgi:hypothetical protein
MATNLIPRNGSACRDQRTYVQKSFRDMPDHELRSIGYGPRVDIALQYSPVSSNVWSARAELERRRAEGVVDREWAVIQKEGFGL